MANEYQKCIVMDPMLHLHIGFEVLDRIRGFYACSYFNIIIIAAYISFWSVLFIYLSSYYSIELV